MATLAQRLEALRKGSAKKIPAEAQEIMHRATEDLAALLKREPGLGVGDTAPAFTLPDHQGNIVDSAARLAQGPLVLTFFRGHW